MVQDSLHVEALDALLFRLRGRPDSVARLLQHNRRVTQGSTVDWRSPLYGAAPREEIIESWSKILYPDCPKWLQPFEEHDQERIGPYSPVSSWVDRAEGLREYFHQDSFSGSSEALGRAVSDVAGLVNTVVYPLTVESAYEVIPSSTNLGLPALTRSKEDAGEYLERAKLVESAGFHDYEAMYPAVLFSRGQPRGLSTTRTRPIWGLEKLETIVGKTVQDPLLKVLRRLEQFAPWLGNDHVDAAVTKAFAEGVPLFSVDFESFDTTIGGWLLNHVEAVMKRWFGEREDERLSWLFHHFRTVGIVTPDGVWKGRDGGIPSGSALTNLVGCLVQLICVYYVAHRLKLKVTTSIVMGDDGVWGFRPTPSVEEVSEVAAELGLVLSPEKSIVSRDMVHFLQRVYHRDYEPDGLNRGVRPTMRVLSGMISHERRVEGWSGEMETVRWIMQVENARWHPSAFVALVTFLYHGDSFLQGGLTPEGALEKVGGQRRAEGLLGITSFPWRGRDLGELPEFETTRILRTLMS